MFVRVQKSFCGWKKKTQKQLFGAFSKILWKIFVVAIKKKLVIQFPYIEIVWLAFFMTKIFYFLFSTIHQNLCQNKRKVLRKFDDTVLAKCMKFVWLVFFHRLSLWKRMISIFGLWRSTRILINHNKNTQAFLMEIVYNFFLILMISKDLKFKRMVDQNHNDATWLELSRI